jgi:hypothetical protein
MKRQMINIAVTVTIVLAMSGSAFAQSRPPSTSPDGCTTALLLAAVAGGLSLMRKLLD